MNLFIGTCPHCGQNIWTSDRVQKDNKDPLEDVYECLACKRHIPLKDIIPF